MDGETGCIGDARDRGDDPARADPPHPPLAEVGQVEVACAVEHELGRLVDSRLPRRAFVAGRAGHARAGEHGELASAKVEPKHLVAKAVRDVQGGAARLEIVGQGCKRTGTAASVAAVNETVTAATRSAIASCFITTSTPRDYGRFP